jgi:hypothetical protein
MLNLQRTFGANSGNVAGASNERQPAMVWVNIGYTVEVQGENGPEARFVSLPVGIPLDTSEPIQLRGRNQDFLQFTKARNELREQLLTAAKGMKPGEEQLVQGLEIQLRVVAEAITDGDVSTSSSPYARRIGVGADASASADAEETAAV